MHMKEKDSYRFSLSGLLYEFENTDDFPRPIAEEDFFDIGLHDGIGYDVCGTGRERRVKNIK